MNNKKISIKFISILLLISLLIGIGGVVLFKPKPAHAGLPVIDWVQQAKEFILDSIIKMMAKTFIQQMVRDITQWARGGFSDENQPFAVTNWARYFKTAVNVGSAMFVQEFNLTPYCSPIRISLQSLGLTTLHSYMPDYTYYAACTLQDIVGNIKDFYENPSISLYGWNAWTVLSQPPNNIIGSFLLAAERRAELEREEKEKKEKEATVSGGYQNLAICTTEDIDTCEKSCHEKHFATDPETAQALLECLQGCKKSSLGICLEEKLKTTGSEIHEALKNSVSSEFQWIISADEISELLGAFITGITQRLISGFYDYQDPSQPVPPVQPKTPSEQKEIIDQIKEGVFENIKLLSQNINQSNPDSQLSITEISDMLFTLFEQRTIQFYSVMEGISPKVDSVIPDKYPLQVAEWISQAAAKYPLVAKINICIGGPVKVLTQTCQPIPASEIEFPGSCSIASIDPDCPNCVNPLCLLTSAAIKNYSRFCNALSLDDTLCEKGTVIKPEPYCGDGNLDLGEECDDGNNIDNDGCSATCELELGGE